MIDNTYDVISTISNLLLHLGIVGKQVYNDELPLSDGKITCKLPAINITMVTNTDVRLTCKNTLQDATLQLTFRDNLASNRQDIITIFNTVRETLRNVKGNIGAITVKDISFRQSRYISESDVAIRRYDLDMRILYYNN